MVLDFKKYVSPPRYAVYERVASICAKDNSVILGEYKTPELAEDARIRWGYITDNYYVDVVKQSK